MFYITALFLSCVLTLLLARYAWARREIPAARTVALVMVGISWWTLFFAIQLLRPAAPDLIPQPESMPLFWFRLMFIGACILPASFLVFVLQYTGIRDRVSWRLFLLLAIEPVLVLSVALTDGFFHDWFLGGFLPGTDDQFLGGPAFWLHTLYSYLLALIAYIIMIRFIVRSRAYRVQASLVLIGGVIASAANIITILQLVPPALEGMDISPFGFLATAILMLLNIRKQGFLDVMPIARSLVFHHMQDGVLVTDAQGRLVDANPVAREHLERAGRTFARGEPLEEFVPGLFSGQKVVDELRMDGRVLNVRMNVFHGASGNVRGAIYSLRDVTELKKIEADLRDKLEHIEELQKALKEESIRDPLTGLFNRRWLDEVLEQEIARALRENRPLIVCLIDLDHFKRVNDQWGHEMGDRVLTALGKLLQEGSRKQDAAARMGGEEFVMVLPGLDPAGAALVIERLKTSFKAFDFSPEGPAGLTFSGGLACVPDHGTDRQTLFRIADRALYRAKAEGRDRLVIAEISKDSEAESGATS